MPPTNDGVTTPPEVNNVWGQLSLGKTTFLTLPSGQTCHAKPVGLQGILETGMLGEADSLTAFVGKEYVRKVRGAKGRADAEEIDPQLLLRSPKTLQKIMKMVDGLTPHVIVAPHVYCHYEVVNPGTAEEDTRMIPEAERVPGGIYTDVLPLEDKMFLFNFALSGVKDAQSFREGSSAAMGNVADGESLQYDPQPDGENRSARRRRPSRRR